MLPGLSELKRLVSAAQRSCLHAPDVASSEASCETRDARAGWAMSGGAIWSGSRRVLAAEVENPAASSPGGAPASQWSTGEIYSGAATGGAAAKNASTQYKVVIVGDSGVGKSCLLVRYTDQVYRNQVSTVGVDFKTRDVTVGQGTRVRLQLWDTAGQERYRATMASYYRGAQGIVLMYSVDDERTFKSIPRWIADVEKAAGPGCAKIHVGNKADVDEKSERQVHYNAAQVRPTDTRAALWHCAGPNH